MRRQLRIETVFRLTLLAVVITVLAFTVLAWPAIGALTTIY